MIKIGVEISPQSRKFRILMRIYQRGSSIPKDELARRDFGFEDLGILFYEGLIASEGENIVLTPKGEEFVIKVLEEKQLSKYKERERKEENSRFIREQFEKTPPEFVIDEFRRDDIIGHFPGIEIWTNKDFNPIFSIEIGGKEFRREDVSKPLIDLIPRQHLLAIVKEIEKLSKEELFRKMREEMKRGDFRIVELREKDGVLKFRGYFDTSEGKVFVEGEYNREGDYFGSFRIEAEIFPGIDLYAYLDSDEASKKVKETLRGRLRQSWTSRFWIK